MKSVDLEILTPRDIFYKGKVESLRVELESGSEGYLPNHIWVRKLLKGKGICEIREAGSNEVRRIILKGGFVEIRDVFTVFTEDAEFI